MNQRSFIFVLTVLAVLLTMPSCLRTRSSMRDDSIPREMGQEVPAEPAQEVEPSASQYVIDEIKLEVTRLEGRVEDLERGSQKGDQKEATQLQERVSRLEQTLGQMSEQLKSLQEKASVVDGKTQFAKGKQEYGQGHYTAAIESFTLFLKNPNTGNPKADLKMKEEATFLRAESFFKIKDYKKAVVDYSVFPEKFNRSSRMPLVLYKIGQSFDSLGMKEDAKGFYQELLEKYPHSVEAKKVKKKKS